MFVITGLVVGILSKMKIHIALLVTFFAILVTLAINKPNYESISAFINFMSLIWLGAIAIGGFIGIKIKRWKVFWWFRNIIK